MAGTEDLFDGEFYELKPGQDWAKVEHKVQAWAPQTSEYQSESEPEETEDLNWVFVHPDEFDQRKYGVAEGWAQIANMLKAISRALGGFPTCYQKGSRYFFQHKLEEE